MKLPIYKLRISEDDTSLVDFIALVDEPAIENNWQAFKEQQRFKVVNEEKRLIMGAFMIADLPIYRVDQRGEYYVVFDKPEIMKIAKRFMSEGFTNNFNLDHDKSQVPEGVYMVESFIIDSERGINVPEGFSGITEGSWMGTVAVDNDEIWNQVKSGEFRGFSIEGVFEYELESATDENEIERIAQKIKELDAKS